MCLIERTKLMFGIHIFSAKSVNKVFYFSIPSVELCFKHYTRTGVITYIAAECGVCFQWNWSELQALSFYFLVKRQAWKDGICLPQALTVRRGTYDTPGGGGTWFFWCYCVVDWMSHKLFFSLGMSAFPFLPLTENDFNTCKFMNNNEHTAHSLTSDLRAC